MFPSCTRRSTSIVSGLEWEGKHLMKQASFADVLEQRVLDIGSKKENISPIVNDIGKNSTAVKPPKNAAAGVEVDLVADQLVEMFGSQRSRPFYCKVAWKLSRETVFRLAQIARADGTRSPGGLFNVLARREMGDI